MPKASTQRQRRSALTSAVKPPSDVSRFIARSSRSRSLDICPSLAYATSSAAHWCGASVSIDTKGKLRFCHSAKPKPAIFVSQIFHALYTLRGGSGVRVCVCDCWRGVGAGSISAEEDLSFYFLLLLHSDRASFSFLDNDLRPEPET